MVAAVIGISLLIRNWENAGPQITITFQNGLANESLPAISRD